MADLRSEFSQLLKEIKENRVDFTQVTNKLERLCFSDNLTINIQVKMITKLANCPTFRPANSLVAEQKVNALLPYLALEKHTVCSFACSLMKILCNSLDPSGQHIATQVMICCKNLLTIITKAEDRNNYGLTICQSIALAAMCSIATEWSCTLKHTNQWFPVALLSLNTAFGVLLNSKMHCFIQQVAVEGLKRTINIGHFWTSLTGTEKMNTLSHIKQLFDLQLCCDGKPSAFILIKLLQTVTSEDVTAFICTSRYLKYFLMVCQKCLPEMNNSKLDLDMPLDVHWQTLKFLWTLLNGMKAHKVIYEALQWETFLDKVKPLFTNGCSNIYSMKRLKEDVGWIISKL